MISRHHDKVEHAFLMDAIYRGCGVALLVLSGGALLWMGGRWAARIFLGG